MSVTLPKFRLDKNSYLKIVWVTVTSLQVKVKAAAKKHRSANSMYFVNLFECHCMKHKVTLSSLTKVRAQVTFVVV